MELNKLTECTDERQLCEWLSEYSEIIKKISNDKTKINWNKNPVKMEDFLSFLTVQVSPTTEHLGYSNGWTKYVGDNGLIIQGGWVQGTEYLDSIQFGSKLHNVYNNFVNPFYIFHLLNRTGRIFFVEYFYEDIKSLLVESENLITQKERQLEIAYENNKKLKNFSAKIAALNGEEYE